MADFDVKLKKLQELLAVEDDCATELGRIQEDISNVKNNLTFKLDISAVIQGQLGSVYTHVGTQKKNVRQLKSGLNAVINRYNREENRICNAKTINLLKGAGKTVSKGLLNVLGQAGVYGTIVSPLITYAKIYIDGDDITAKSSILSMLQGVNDFIKGLGEYDKKKGFKALAGLEKYEGIVLNDAKASWWETLYKGTFEDLEEGNKVVKHATVAGWLLTGVERGIDNWHEYKNSDDMTWLRAAAETMTETVVDIAKTAIITAGIAAGMAAIGVSAPAVVVGTAVVAVSAVADYACKKITANSKNGVEKDVTEVVSDWLLDTKTKEFKMKIGAVDTARKAVSGWWTRMVQNGSLQFA